MFVYFLVIFYNFFFFTDFDGYYITDEGQPRPRYIFNKCGTITSTFLLYKGLVHHHHRILNTLFLFPEEVWIVRQSSGLITRSVVSNVVCFISCKYIFSHLYGLIHFSLRLQLLPNLYCKNLPLLIGHSHLCMEGHLTLH